MLHPPMQVRLGLAARYGAGDAGSRHRSQKLLACSRSGEGKVDWATLGEPDIDAAAALIAPSGAAPSISCSTRIC